LIFLKSRFSVSQYGFLYDWLNYSQVSDLSAHRTQFGSHTYQLFKMLPRPCCRGIFHYRFFRLLTFESNRKNELCMKVVLSCLNWLCLHRMRIRWLVVNTAAWLALVSFFLAPPPSSTSSSFFVFFPFLLSFSFLCSFLFLFLFIFAWLCRYWLDGLRSVSPRPLALISID